jgi:hypothetical protein
MTPRQNAIERCEEINRLLESDSLNQSQRPELEKELDAIADNMAEGCYSNDPDDGIDWSNCPGIYNTPKPKETVIVTDSHTSPDFQCDQTGGYPTVLVWNQDRGTAVLQPAPAFDDDTEEAKQCILDCADWGVHPCTSWEDYNNLLESIGKDAVRNAYVPDEDESEEFGGMSIC